MAEELISQEKFEELTRELDEMKTTRRREVAEQLEYARSLGDLSENAEYQEAREMQASVEERIGKLENILKNAKIVRAGKSDGVSMGSVVAVQKIGSDEKHTYTVVGAEEADMLEGKISYHSPLGSALMGKKKGEEFFGEGVRRFQIYIEDPVPGFFREILDRGVFGHGRIVNQHVKDLRERTEFFLEAADRLKIGEIELETPGTEGDQLFGSRFVFEVGKKDCGSGLKGLPDKSASECARPTGNEDIFLGKRRFQLHSKAGPLQHLEIFLDRVSRGRKVTSDNQTVRPALKRLFLFLRCEMDLPAAGQFDIGLWVNKSINSDGF